MEKEENISLKSIRKIIFLSLFSTLTLFFLILATTRALKAFFFSDRFSITFLITRSHSPERIAPALFAELLDLSSSAKKNFYLFNSKEARSELLSTAWLEEVKIKKLFPDTLKIDYRMRQPLGSLADYSNTYFDRSGKLFPANPYFSPKKLPEVRVGEIQPEKIWGSHIDEEKLSYLKALFSKIPKSKIEKIDLTHFSHKSLGRREVILTLTSGHILRLNPKNQSVALKNFYALEKSLKRGVPYVIDLRLRDAAFIMRKEICPATLISKFTGRQKIEKRQEKLQTHLLEKDLSPVPILSHPLNRSLSGSGREKLKPKKR